MTSVLVCAETEAHVFQVCCAAGDRVERGYQLVILESMKMEIPVEAPASARVLEVRVAVGERVAPGVVLVVLAPG